MQSVTRLLRPFVGLVLTCVFVYLASRQVHVADVQAVYARLSLAPIILALLFLIADYFLKIVRWWNLLRVFNPELPLRRCAWPLIVGFAMNNVLPLRAGDIARAFGFRETLQAPAGRIIGTLVLERLADLFVLLGCFLLGWSMLDSERFSDSFVRLGSWALAAAIAALALLLFAPVHLRRISLWLIDGLSRKTDQPIFNKLRPSVEHLFEVLETIASRTLLVRILLLSITAWLCEAGIFGVLATALGSSVSLSGVLFVMGASTLATLIPSSPGYVGTFDYFAIQAAVINGMAPGEAAVFAIAVHLLLWAPLTLAGGLYFIRPDAKRWWQQTKTAADSNA